jgi:hypothetical protein
VLGLGILPLIGLRAAGAGDLHDLAWVYSIIILGVAGLVLCIVLAGTTDSRVTAPRVAAAAVLNLSAVGVLVGMILLS